MNRGYKYQTQIFTLETGTPAGVVKKTITLDTIGEAAIGVNIRPISTGNLSYFGIGLQDDRETYADVQDYRNFVPGSAAGLSMEDQFRTINIPADGNRVSINIKTLDVTAGPLSFEINFVLKRKPVAA